MTSASEAPSKPIPPLSLVKASPGAAWLDETPTTAKAAAPAEPSRPAEPAQSRPRRHRRRGGRFLIWLSFLFFVVGPTSAIGYYFFTIASPQYMVEMQFAVRGSSEEPLGFLGLSALPGATTQSSDSYIVQNYIRSQQLAKDVLAEQGVDIRQAYAHDFIDPLYKIEPDYPYIDWESYWQRMVSVEFNNISGNTTVRVFAFAPEDALTIADAILEQSENVVNALADDSRQQLLGAAQAEVDRTEGRLRAARLRMQEFRNDTQVLTEDSLGQIEFDIVGELEQELSRMVTRRRLLEDRVDVDSPIVRDLDLQIAATREQLRQERSRIGSSANVGGDRSLADVATELVDLTTSQEFATAAYTAALEALEAARADARQQERYLATYIPASLPTESRHPKPYLYTGIAFIWAFFAWLVALFLIRTIRDHTA
ncbi:MAG: hypothetical protein AAFN79_18005 [Pseudomonadota bacterium]